MIRISFLLALVFVVNAVSGQLTLKGKVRDAGNGEPVFMANVIEKGTTNGVTTDFEGEFKLKVDKLPVTLQVSFIGYSVAEVLVTEVNQRIEVMLSADQIMLEEARVVGERISERQKQAPLTVETMDVIAIKEAPSGSFYEGLGNLKGVDMTSASLGFKVINTRGFNSTSPVRSLQLIDGVDNQSPGLNFSLGNFLGASDLDVRSVEIVAGASSAFFGPGAFNGVINMESKNPFQYPGLSVSFKAGERSLFEHAVRYAEIIKNKNGDDLFAFKINFYSMQARDWEADNYDPVDDSGVPADNPGRFNAVNIYGDEYFPAMDFSTSAPWNSRGLETFFRTGYREIDLVDYNTNNLKANFAAHLRTRPDQKYDSPELVYSFNLGNGTTVYQGDNRFSLRDIVFWQNRLEYRKTGKFFIRAYSTQEDAGNSYDPYATALRLLEEARDPNEWAQVYAKYWSDSIAAQVVELGIPPLTPNPNWPGPVEDPNFLEFYLPYDFEGYEQFLIDNNTTLTEFHSQVEAWTNSGNGGIPGISQVGYLAPGTPEFEEAFNRLTRSRNNSDQNGTRFFDQSALYHLHGEYIFEPSFIDQIRVGANGRMYRPFSDGTIFSDTAGVRITNREWGAYLGLEQKFKEDRYIVSGTIRVDKNENFDYVFSPALSVVWKPGEFDYLRLTFSSALRNPTLADQYLFLDVGPAILAGNLNGVEDLITLESFSTYRNSQNPQDIEYFDIAPIRPEQVRTVEAGYRTTLFDKLYVDAGAYYSVYTNFIGFNIGLTADFDPLTGGVSNIQAFRYSANSLNEVQTSGVSIGLNYYLDDNFALNGNYSFNRLVQTDEDDPIIPAFNTPENKFNLGITARDLKSNLGRGNIWGFGVNYKWIQGFMFEGSPQFTGFVPTYSLVDAQVNYYVNTINTTFKLGASNLLNNMQFQTYGGPRIGRLAYFSILYELAK